MPPNEHAAALRDHIDVLKALGLRNQQIAQHPLVATHPLVAEHMSRRLGDGGFHTMSRSPQTSRTYGQGQPRLHEPTQRPLPPGRPIGPPGGLQVPKGGMPGYTTPPRPLAPLPTYTPSGGAPGPPPFRGTPDPATRPTGGAAAPPWRDGVFRGAPLPLPPGVPGSAGVLTPPRPLRPPRITPQTRSPQPPTASWLRGRFTGY